MALPRVMSQEKGPKNTLAFFVFFQKFKNRANLIYPKYTESELMQLNH
jgi:hypothetical protein